MHGILVSMNWWKLYKGVIRTKDLRGNTSRCHTWFQTKESGSIDVSAQTTRIYNANKIDKVSYIVSLMKRDITGTSKVVLMIRYLCVEEDGTNGKDYHSYCTRDIDKRVRKKPLSWDLYKSCDKMF